VYALAAGEPYWLGGEDLTSIVNTARRRHRSVWEILEELDRQPGILRLSNATRAAASRLVADLRRYSQLAHDRPAGEVLFTFLRDAGVIGRLAASDSVAAEEELRNIARFFDIIRGQSSLLADDRMVFVARHLDTLIEAGDDPPTADLDPDADAVAVLTVHKAKGLEFPVVFMPGLVAGRFPTHGRREPLGIPLELVRETLPEGDFQLQEERRLFYVGMTRARNELVLTYAADYGGGIARRLSPFVLEALDLPPQAAVPGAGVSATPPIERIAAARPAPPDVTTTRGATSEPLLLSFYAIDDYLSCPLKFKYGHVLRVPIAPHHALIYGSALHKAIQEFHRRQARGDIMSDDELAAAFELAWTNEGFLTREHEEARLASGREALRRFREEQLKPGAVVPAYVEREFSFSLDGDRVRGRWDRVDIEPAAEAPTAEAPTAEVTGPAARAHADTVSPTLGLTGRERVTITDYKSSDVRDPAKARQRTRDSLQLQIYAMGYEALTGRLPDYLQLHFLDSGLVGRAEVDQKRLAKARQKIATAAAGMRQRDYTPKPDRMTCTYCPYREICPSSVAT
jgi:DNA helicase-2/ATP-dependent DNA helicase PcrA